MFIVLTIAVPIMIAILAPASYYLIFHEPRKRLSPEAYRRKMNELEDYRFKAIESAKTGEDIDVANETIDSLAKTYKSRRK